MSSVLIQASDEQPVAVDVRRVSGARAAEEVPREILISNPVRSPHVRLKTGRFSSRCHRLRAVSLDCLHTPSAFDVHEGETFILHADGVVTVHRVHVVEKTSSSLAFSILKVGCSTA